MVSGAFSAFDVAITAPAFQWDRICQILQLEYSQEEPLSVLLQNIGERLKQHKLTVYSSTVAVLADPELHVEPCPQGALEWHWESLCALAGLPEVTQVESVRAWYHQRMIETLLDPAQITPLVSIVIPAYNESETLLRSTVQSALSQTWPNCEVVLIDDGSQRPASELLGELASQVRCIRQPNSGVAEARNHGIAQSRGEFIHFLDADDLLDPTCVEEKVRVFQAVADIELCFSHYRCEGDNGVKNADNHVVPKVGDEFCPSRGLLQTVLQRFPFQISSIMLPRWVALDAGPFDRDLRQSQDNRQWFRLALRGTKVAGLNRDLNTRRFRPGSLTSCSSQSRWYAIQSYLRNFMDMCHSPEHWISLPVYFKRALHHNRVPLLFQLKSRKAERLRNELIRCLESMSAVGATAGLSSIPVVESMRWKLAELFEKNPDKIGAGLFDQLSQAFDKITVGAPEISETDLRLWLDTPMTSSMWEESCPAIRQLELGLTSLADRLPRRQVEFWQHRFFQIWHATSRKTREALQTAPVDRELLKAA